MKYVLVRTPAAKSHGYDYWTCDMLHVIGSIPMNANKGFYDFYFIDDKGRVIPFTRDSLMAERLDLLNHPDFKNLDLDSHLET